MYGGNSSIDARASVLIDTGSSAADIARLESEIQALRTAQLAQAQASRAAGKSLEEVAAEAQATGARIADLTAVLERYRSVTGGGVVKDSAAASRAILELSRGLEDLSTGGVVGGLNNLPGLAQAAAKAFGVSATAAASLTTAVSLVGTAAYLLYSNWDTLMGLFGSGKVETEAEEMKRLGKETSLTADQTKRLHDLQEAERKRKEAESEDKRLEGLKSKEAVARGAGVRTAIGEGGGYELILGGLVDQRIAEMVRNKAISPQDPEGMGRARRTTEEGFRAQLRGAAEGNKSDRDDLRRLADADTTGRLGAFGRTLVSESPEHKRAQEAAKASSKAAADAFGLDESEMKAASDAAGAKIKATVAGLIKAIADAAEDTESPVADRMAAVARAKGAAETARTDRGFGLPGDDLAKIRERADDAERKLQLEGAREEKAGDTAEARAEQAADARAKKAGKPYLERIEAALLANARKIDSGAPIARTGQDMARLRLNGFDPAVPPELLERQLSGEVGTMLARSRQDSRLAPRIVRDAARGLDARRNAAVGAIGDPDNPMGSGQVDASVAGQLGAAVEKHGRAALGVAQNQANVNAVLARYAAQAAEMERLNAANRAGLSQVHGHLGRLRNQRPSLQRRAN